MNTSWNTEVSLFLDLYYNLLVNPDSRCEEDIVGSYFMRNGRARRVMVNNSIVHPGWRRKLE
jgi:hypothetical protein